MFQSRHYRQIAKVLHEYRQEALRVPLPLQLRQGRRDAIAHIAGDLAAMFHADNPNFKPDMFLKAVFQEDDDQ